MSNEKVSICKERKEGVILYFEIHTDFSSGCKTPCQCSLPSNCEYKGVTEKYFKDNIKPVLIGLFGNKGFFYELTTEIEFESTRHFIFLIYVRKGSVIPEDFSTILNGLVEEEKEITKMSY